MNRGKLLDHHSALIWQMQMGIDETVMNRPFDRFSSPLSTVEPNQVRQKDDAQAGPKIEAGHLRSPSSGQATELQALQVAEAANTLNDLRSAIAGFEGCSLKRTAKSTVFADGNPDAELMLIGEAPGAEEDRLGKPFVGPSGHLLDKMMAAIGLSRESGYYISNILPWRPPGNRKPTPIETAICLPFIKRHIEIKKPRILVLLGATPVSALLARTEGITRLRGGWQTLQIGLQEFDVLPTYHPAYLLRQPRFKVDTWRDLLEIKSRLES
jgi:DNA polymerase